MRNISWKSGRIGARKLTSSGNEISVSPICVFHVNDLQSS